MIIVGDLDCGGCGKVTTFVVYPEDGQVIDENLAECRECGYVFGYTVDQRIDVGDAGERIVVSVTRPVLAPATLEAAMRKHQARQRAVLAARLGVAPANLDAFAQANARLQRGLREQDPDARRALLGGRSPYGRKG